MLRPQRRSPAPTSSCCSRGTGEPPGVGGVGQAFVDAVRAQAGPRTVGVYAVNYPASDNFADREGLAATVKDGIRDEEGHVQAMAANCPNTKLVLSGYSQGAVVSGFVTSAGVPASVVAESAPQPLPPEVADKVAAVVLFATPSASSCSSSARPRSPSDRCMPTRPCSCATPATRSARAHPVADRISRIRSTQ